MTKLTFTYKVLEPCKMHSPLPDIVVNRSKAWLHFDDSISHQLLHLQCQYALKYSKQEPAKR